MAEKVAATAAAFTIAASGSVTVYGVVFQSIESFIGVCVMVATFFVSWHYNRKRIKILEKEKE